MNGSVHKIPDRPKPWRARYRGPDGVEHSKTYRRKVDAERWLRGELGKTDRGAWIDPSAGELDFADWSAGWLRGLILKPKTRAGYQSLLRSRVLPRFGPVPIARITPGEARAWMTDMTEEGLSAPRIRQARQGTPRRPRAGGHRRSAGPQPDSTGETPDGPPTTAAVPHRGGTCGPERSL